MLPGIQGAQQGGWGHTRHGHRVLMKSNKNGRAWCGCAECGKARPTLAVAEEEACLGCSRMRRSAAASLGASTRHHMVMLCRAAVHRAAVKAESGCDQEASRPAPNPSPPAPG